MPASTDYVQETSRSGLNEARAVARGSEEDQPWAPGPGHTGPRGCKQNKEVMVDLETLGNSRRFLSRRVPDHSGRSGAGERG